MKKRMKRSLCCLMLASLLLFAAAFSESVSFSAGAARLQAAWQAGGTIEADASLTISKWQSIESGALTVIQSWLSKTGFILQVSENSGAFVIRQGEDALFSYLYDQDVLCVNGQTMRLGEHGAETLLPSPGAEPLLCLQQVLSALPAAEEIAAAEAEPTQNGRKTLSFVGSMEQQRRYTLSAETSLSVLSCLREPALALFSLLPAAEEETTPDWSAAAVSDDMTITFYEDAAGVLRGVEAETVMLLEQEPRTVKLFFAMSSSGINGSFTASSKNGSDKQSLSLSGRIDGNELTGKLEYVLRVNGKKRTLSASLTLNDRTGENGEKLSGKLTLTSNFSGTEQTWTLKPELLFGENDAEGSMDVSLKKGETTVFRAGLQLALRQAEPLFSAEPQSMPVEAYARDRVQDIMLETLAKIMKALPKEERYLLTHALRDDSWMAISQDVNDFADEDDFEVLDEY